MYVADALYYVLLLLFTCQIISCSQRSANFTRNNEFDGRNCEVNETVVQIGNIASILMCSSVCLHKNECKSFFYQPETKQCHGCRTGYGAHDNKVPSTELAGSIYYTSYTYRYFGCYESSAFDDYAFLDNAEDITPELCVGSCAADGYTYSIIQVELCICSNAVNEQRRMSDSQCDNNECPGDSSLMCGGRNEFWFSVYVTGL